jgi:hypothetical protein
MAFADIYTETCLLFVLVVRQPRASYYYYPLPDWLFLLLRNEIYWSSNPASRLLPHCLVLELTSDDNTGNFFLSAENYFPLSLNRRTRKFS